eukprot:TRINITY_DN95060_c0_g1_i1.p1 TRINITY_DN95060_c0_g1~~TRINITY_DN95060_c0_g1_i1.p1  ORF type:complete len:462 (+),score=82.58 TRINITY_DN95060_c0_g1_i1:37-1386(+)
MACIVHRQSAVMMGREGKLRLILVRMVVLGLCGAILATAQGHWSSAFYAQIGWLRRHPTGQTRFLRLSQGLSTPGLRHLSQPGLATGAEGSAAQPAAAADKKDITESLAVQGGLFVTYFLVQSGMSFYMKWILSKVKVASDLVGVPASFLVTASQQLVAFGLFIVFMLGSRLIGKPYRPKILTSRTEFLLVLGLSLSFSLNIGLNLLSLSLVPLSLTMIIRACSPLSTAFMQALIMKKKQDISAAEWCCLSVGVFCACAVVVAQSGGPSGKASFAFFFGVAMSVASLFSAGLDFVFKGVLGTNVKLNALDTTCYMALPVAFLTSIFGAILSKPVSSSWAARFAPRMTDLAVFQKLWEVNPGVLGCVLVSGLLAFVYNIFVTFLCVNLSPATAAFAGNFNKSATILLSLLVLEGTMMNGPRGLVTVGAVLGNIVAFTLYNLLKKQRQMKK